jgi:mRNA interferase MazF
MKRPLRGEVWLVDLGLVAKVRPCLIVSVPPEDSDRALFALLAHTTSTRGTAFEVPVRIRFLKPGAFDIQNIVTVPRARMIRKLGELDPDQLKSIEAALVRWLGLE